MKSKSGITIVLILFSILSCSKNSGSGTSTSSCKIISLYDSANGSGSTFNFSYNNNGEISTIQNTNATTGYTEVFTYGNNLILVTKTSIGGVFQSSDSIGLNSAGLMTIDVQVDASNNRTIDAYTYNSSNQLLTSTNQSNGGTVTTYNYTYTGGDLASYTDGTNVVTLTYFTNKSTAQGDYLNIFQLFNYGDEFIKNTHLSESLQAGGTIENFNYTFDSSGKITKLTATSGATVETVIYQYQCN
jgi:hypothetical protein